MRTLLQSLLHICCGRCRGLDTSSTIWRPARGRVQCRRKSVQRPSWPRSRCASRRFPDSPARPMASSHPPTGFPPPPQTSPRRRPPRRRDGGRKKSERRPRPNREKAAGGTCKPTMKAADRAAASTRIGTVEYPLGDSTGASGFVGIRPESPYIAWDYGILTAPSSSRRPRLRGWFHTLPHLGPAAPR